MTIKIDFTELVEEAQREPLEFDIGDGGPPITVMFPTGEQAEILDKARFSGDESGMMLALFGLEQGERINAFMRGAPADLPGRLVTRVFAEFELPGNSAASSA